MERTITFNLGSSTVVGPDGYEHYSQIAVSVKSVVGDVTIEFCNNDVSNSCVYDLLWKVHDDVLESLRKSSPIYVRTSALVKLSERWCTCCKLCVLKSIDSLHDALAWGKEFVFDSKNYVVACISTDPKRTPEERRTLDHIDHTAVGPKDEPETNTGAIPVSPVDSAGDTGKVPNLTTPHSAAKFLFGYESIILDHGTNGPFDVVDTISKEELYSVPSIAAQVRPVNSSSSIGKLTVDEKVCGLLEDGGLIYLCKSALHSCEEHAKLGMLSRRKFNALTCDVVDKLSDYRMLVYQSTLRGPSMDNTSYDGSDGIDVFEQTADSVLPPIPLSSMPPMFGSGTNVSSTASSTASQAQPVGQLPGPYPYMSPMQSVPQVPQLPTPITGKSVSKVESMVYTYTPVPQMMFTQPPAPCIPCIPPLPSMPSFDQQHPIPDIPGMYQGAPMSCMPCFSLGSATSEEYERVRATREKYGITDSEDGTVKAFTLAAKFQKLPMLRSVSIDSDVDRDINAMLSLYAKHNPDVTKTKLFTEMEKHTWYHDEIRQFQKGFTNSMLQAGLAREFYDVKYREFDYDSEWVFNESKLARFYDSLKGWRERYNNHNQNQDGPDGQEDKGVNRINRMRFVLRSMVGPALDSLDLTETYITGSAICAALTISRFDTLDEVKRELELKYPVYEYEMKEDTRSMLLSEIQACHKAGNKCTPTFNKARSYITINEQRADEQPGNQGKDCGSGSKNGKNNGNAGKNPNPPSALADYINRVCSPAPQARSPSYPMPHQNSHYDGFGVLCENGVRCYPATIKSSTDIDMLYRGPADKFEETANKHFRVFQRVHPFNKLTLKKHIINEEKGYFRFTILDEKDPSFRNIEIYQADPKNIFTHHVGAVRGYYGNNNGTNKFYVATSAVIAVEEARTPNYYYFASKKKSPLDIVYRYRFRGISLPHEIRRIMHDLFGMPDITHVGDPNEGMPISPYVLDNPNVIRQY